MSKGTDNPSKDAEGSSFKTAEGSFWMAAWYERRGWPARLVWLLLPVAWLFRGLAALRRFLIQVRLPGAVHSLGVPVIVVGNITLGGTGKTPLLIALANRLRAAGWRPGIISRGYGGQAQNYPLRVTAQSSPTQAGDEPVLIALETGCPVMVGPDRWAAARQLLQQTDCNVLLSDDGLQHYRLPRELEIVVIDGGRGLGNRQCLPVGPLREPPSRLRTVNWVVVNGGAREPGPIPATAVDMRLEPQSWHSLLNKTEQEQLPETGRVHAVAGIGNPERFFQTLRELGLEVVAHPFPDHHSYSPEDLAFGDELPVAMTAKDAVKCREFAQPHWWYLSVAAQLPESFYQELLERLDNVGRLKQKPQSNGT